MPSSVPTLPEFSSTAAPFPIPVRQQTCDRCVNWWRDAIMELPVVVNGVVRGHIPAAYCPVTGVQMAPADGCSAWQLRT